MRKIIIQLPDRHSETNMELLKIRNCFIQKIKELGGLENCRENIDLINEMIKTEKQYDENHPNIIDRFLYHGTVHWDVIQYDETKETIKIYQLNDGGEILKKSTIKKEKLL